MNAELLARVARATVADADALGAILHAFNTEFDTPSPGPGVLAARLRHLLATDHTFAITAGNPRVAIALVTLRSNVWYDGRVATLDELYVAPELRGRGLGTAMIRELVSVASERGVESIEVNVDEGDVDAQRFYLRHGFTMADPSTEERAFYFFRELLG